MGHDAELPSEPPRRHRDDSPCRQGGNESASDACRDGEMEDGGECHKADTSPGRAGRVERGRLLATAPAAQTGLLLGAALMAFDQRGAGAEDRREREEEPPDGHTEARTQDPRE